MSDVLVDTSVWIDYLRNRPEAVRRLEPLLLDSRVATCGPVYAEVLSGAVDASDYDGLAAGFSALTWLDAPESAWREVAELRFRLARRGTQAHLADLLIAVTALSTRHSLLTRDKDFTRIARVTSLDLEVF